MSGEPFNEFLSFSSYLLHNAYRSSRASLYSCVVLIILRILVEDSAVIRHVCDNKYVTHIRLCRQRQPFLPFARIERARVNFILDVVVDGINHNLRRRLDVELYILLLDPLLRLITYLSRSRTRINHHWGELWRSLLSLLRFLDTYANILKPLPNMERLADAVVNVLALALSAGESFLPDAKSFDDLFYKVFESGEALSKFRDSFGLSKRPSSANIGILISVSSHYEGLLDEKKGKGNKNVTSREVRDIIKQGYETLSIQAKEGLDHWEVYREADYRNIMKKVAKVAVQDVKTLLALRP